MAWFAEIFLVTTNNKQQARSKKQEARSKKKEERRKKKEERRKTLATGFHKKHGSI
ncbi:hypothetical protein [Shewanella seohaensis]|uniref:hypothetical protein n=1 Tax=Shewanella seohaensis TaxID=755175 RepID=UPI0035B9BA1D